MPKNCLTCKWFSEGGEYRNSGKCIWGEHNLCPQPYKSRPIHICGDECFWGYEGPSMQFVIRDCPAHAEKGEG